MPIISVYPDQERGLSVKGYLKRFGGHRWLFGRNILIEYDYRFYQRSELMQQNHRRGCIYGNILDAGLDFIGRYENLHDDMREVGKRIGKKEPFDHHVERAKADMPRPPTLSDRDIARIRKIFSRDIKQFGYPDRGGVVLQAP